MHKVTFILLVIGGLNWLLVGLLGWDIGALFGGMDAFVSRVIYILVGISAIYEVTTHWDSYRKCAASSTQAMPMR